MCGITKQNLHFPSNEGPSEALSDGGHAERVVAAARVPADGGGGARGRRGVPGHFAAGDDADAVHPVELVPTWMRPWTCWRAAARGSLSEECLSPVTTTRKWTSASLSAPRTEIFHLFIEGRGGTCSPRSAWGRFRPVALRHCSDEESQRRLNDSGGRKKRRNLGPLTSSSPSVLTGRTVCYDAAGRRKS